MERVLVTGASRGIGAGVATRLARKGFDLVLWARTQSELDAVASECRSHGVAVDTATVDVADPDAVASAAASSLQDIDGLRGCVVNAGSATFGRLSAYSTEEWRTVIGTNLDGAFFTLRATLPLLDRRPGSQVVVMGSQSALYGFEDQVGYCASKWGLNGLVETVRREHRASGVRITNVVLGPVDTFFRGKKPGDRPGSLEIDDVGTVVETLFELPPNIEIREIHATSVLAPFGPFPERYVDE